MKRILLTLLLCAVTAVSVSAQPRLRKKYTDIGFVNQTLTIGEKVRSEYGFSLANGRSYYLHRKPIAGMLRFGIDATWIDLTYVRYPSLHEADIAMQVGASLSVSPVNRMNIHAYFRYAPTFSMWINDNFRGNYATMFVAGATVSYSIIGVGAEYRFGDINRDKAKYSGGRFFVSFRF